MPAGLGRTARRLDAWGQAAVVSIAETLLRRRTLQRRALLDRLHSLTRFRGVRGIAPLTAIPRQPPNSFGGGAL
jgi:hypothetical protein